MRQALSIGVMERLGIRANTTTKDVDQIDSEIMPSTISADYESLITECFQCLGLSPELVRVSVRPVGMNPAGLEVYDETGRLTRRYTTLDGLPENTLTCLERYHERLTAHRNALAAEARRLNWSFIVHHTDRPAEEVVLAIHNRLAGLERDYRFRPSTPVAVGAANQGSRA